MTNQLATIPEKLTILSFLKGNKREDFAINLKALLPSFYPPEKMIALAYKLYKEKDFSNCNPLSFISAIQNCAQLGFDPTGPLEQVYIVPYGKEVNFEVSYNGFLDLIRRTDQVIHFDCGVVYEKDVFQYEQGFTPILRHVKAFNDKPSIFKCVYACMVLKSGEKLAAVLDKPKVEHHRSFSKQKNGSTWTNHWEAMAKKTSIRELYKLAPKTLDLINKAFKMENTTSFEPTQEITLENANNKIELTTPINESPEIEFDLDTGEIFDNDNEQNS